MKSIPCFFIHIGNQEYLRYVIECAENSNGNVFLLGDKSNKDFAKNWFSIDDYKDDDVTQFMKSYVHMSDNSPVFDTQCIQRYFLLRNFMCKHKMKDACMLDSDLLLYVDLKKVIQKRDRVYFSFRYDKAGNIVSSSAHCAYWPLDKLEQFCDFILKTYTQNIDMLKELYKKKMKIHYRYISDMDLLDIWANQNSNSILSTDIVRNGSVFDHNINSIDSFQKNCLGFKKVCRKKNLLYFQKNGKLVRVNSIHAQGEAKIYIKLFLHKRTCILWYLICDVLAKRK